MGRCALAAADKSRVTLQHEQVRGDLTGRRGGPGTYGVLGVYAIRGAGSFGRTAMQEGRGDSHQSRRALALREEGHPTPVAACHGYARTERHSGTERQYDTGTITNTDTAACTRAGAGPVD